MNDTIALLRKILQNKQLSLEEVNTFVVGYVEKVKNKIPTEKELQGILAFLQNGMFNIRYAAKEYAKLINCQVIEVINLKTNAILKTDIYEL